MPPLAPHPRGSGTLRPEAGARHPLGSTSGQSRPRRARGPPAPWPAGAGLGHHPHAPGRREDHHLGGSGHGTLPPWPQRRGRAPRAVLGTGVRRQGRRYGRRRGHPGASPGHQPAFYRRHPRGGCGQQPARRAGGQRAALPPSGGAGPEKRALAALPGHERPVSARDCDRTRGGGRTEWCARPASTSPPPAR